MKAKYLLLGLGLLPLISACSSDDHDGPEVGTNAIQFNANAPRAIVTRDATTTATLRAIKVSAYLAGTTTPYMDGITVSKGTGDTWTYSPLMYWPIGNSLNFFSYAPTTVTAYRAPATATDGATFANYDNTGGTTDLLYGVNMGLSYDGSATSSPQVKISMNHALSQVRFEVNNKAGVTTYAKIYGVQLVNVSQTGTFTFPTTTTTQTVKGTWSDLGTANGTYNVYEDANGSKISTPATAGGEAVEIPTDRFEFAVPQTLQKFVASTTGAMPAGTYAAVRCIIYDSKTNQPVWPRTGAPGYDPKTKSALVFFPLDAAVATGSSTVLAAWNPGCAYIYTLNISVPNNDGAILFGEVIVTNFQDFTASVENHNK